MREWIRVEDRLPETDDAVWVSVKEDYCGDNFVSITFYDKYEPEWDKYDGFVVAWMYLDTNPEPPEPYDPNKSSVSKDYITSDDTDEEAVETLIGKIHRENGKCDSVELADDFMNCSDSLDDTWTLRQILNLIHINSYKEK